jgi:hypothetical protein
MTIYHIEWIAYGASRKHLGNEAAGALLDAKWATVIAV